MAKSSSPFAGFKLTEQAAAPAGPDQRLFGPAPQPPSPQPQFHQGSKEATLQARKVGNKEPRNLGNQEPVAETVIEKSAFDLDETPYRNDTFSFTDAELDAIEDMKIDLRRKHGIRGTKNNLVRCAIHHLVEDYKRLGGQSIAVRRLRRTTP